LPHSFPAGEKIPGRDKSISRLLTGEMMKRLEILLAGGSCGSTLFLIADEIDHQLSDVWDVPYRLTLQNIWDRFDAPARTDLILQTMPAYNPSQVSCPILSVKPMIRDRDHPETLEAIRAMVERLLVSVQEVGSD
jgi:hypothetical protein